jgi:hypothetical protein
LEKVPPSKWEQISEYELAGFHPEIPNQPNFDDRMEKLAVALGPVVHQVHRELCWPEPPTSNAPEPPTRAHNRPPSEHEENPPARMADARGEPLTEAEHQVILSMHRSQMSTAQIRDIVTHQCR